MGISVKKKIIAELDKCYSIAPIRHKGQDCILVAAEKVDRCLLMDRDGNVLETVWSEPGGVMTMVAVPNTESQFLATHRFYSANDSAESSIVFAAAKADGRWEVKTLVELPFVHRFDIIPSKGRYYLVACTIKSDHKYREDWTSPGKIYIAELPENLEGFIDSGSKLEWEQIFDGLTQNHGYYRADTATSPRSIISARDGVFLLTPPLEGEDRWKLDKILDSPGSDSALIDLDGDGVDELAVLSPFHGDNIDIYKHDGKEYKRVYSYDGGAEFCHAIFAGKIDGRNALIIGHRKSTRDLILFDYDSKEGKYITSIIDADVGPANIYHYVENGEDRLISTNREINEIAMYSLSWE